MQHTAVLNKEGGETGVYEYDGNVAARALESIGKHTRFYPTEPRESTDTTINVLVANPEWISIRSAIIRALQPFPEAREAVVEAMREAEAGGQPRPLALG